MRHFVRLCCLALPVVVSLSACAPAAMVGSGSVATGMLGERRGAEDYMSDSWIGTKIETAYIRSDKIKAGNINVDVYQKKVLLTGTANSEEEIAEAIRLAKGMEGVVRVNSELKVQYASASDVAEDTLITSKVKTNLVTSNDVRGVDFHVRTVKGVVFLIGTAAGITERDRAVQIARSIKGVKEVVSYIEINATAEPLIGGKNSAPAGK